MKVFPFGYYIVNEYQYCPKCSAQLCKDNEVDRKICSGSFFKRCPRTGHFHRSCKYCKFKWLEATFDVSDKEIDFVLREVFDRAAEAGMDEERIIWVWRDQAVKKVMDT